MGLIDDIKNESAQKNVPIQSATERDIEAAINRLFYLPPGPERELAFIRQMFTRGSDTSERSGLHASALIVSDDTFCIRQQVLSLLYRQLQGEQVKVGLRRIFAAGDAIHEKYQRLFLRGGWCEPMDLDYTRYIAGGLSFTPDAIIQTSDLFDGERCIVEIKSVNTHSFRKQTEHASGKKQCLFYMRLLHIKHGFVLCEDKNTQDIRAYYYKWPGPDGEYRDITDVFVDRFEEIKRRKVAVLDKGRIPKRHCACTTIDDDKARVCPMRDVCFGRSKERL